MAARCPIKRREYAQAYYAKRRATGEAQAKMKAYAEANKEKVAAKQREWALANPERAAANKRACYERNKAKYYEANQKWLKENKYRRPDTEANRAYQKQYQAANKDRLNAERTKWRKENTGRWNATRAAYRAAKAQRMPVWLTDDDKEQIATLYGRARELQMHVDHVVPLRGERVSGLHVPWNLQLLPPVENHAKSNKF